MGQFANSLREGSGIYKYFFFLLHFRFCFQFYSALRYGNGDVYVGQWKMNKRHGQVSEQHSEHASQADCELLHLIFICSQGKMSFANGDEFEGLWQDDTMHVSSGAFICLQSVPVATSNPQLQ